MKRQGSSVSAKAVAAAAAVAEAASPAKTRKSARTQQTAEFGQQSNNGTKAVAEEESKSARKRRTSFVKFDSEIPKS